MLARRPLPASRVAAALVLGAAVVAGVALLLVFDPNAGDNPLPRCVFQMVTGLYCPGCGMTRALHALLHGDLATAWAMNPLVVLMLATAPLMAWHQLKLQPALPARMSRLLMDGKLWIASLILFGVLRNLPWSGFAWMAPG
ncbi:DUF2752 domain-containing protein [Lysobacter niastensis]|uniref:DUF2752 domain-containing protein n=1 Tax=Lysobacter niastensis TaxID=380629 RepID=A0ABS0BAF7_9GAMM|nr:DUF2752 domain-containing protein [Lysobacter niastensis]MBF6024135.1 DUF2752 domain-containing protein [Lysobacter niastensis]